MKAQKFIGCLLFIAPLAALAGVHFESIKRDTETGKETAVQSMWVDNGMARIESTRGSVMIFRDDKIYTLDVAKKKNILSWIKRLSSNRWRRWTT